MEYYLHESGLKVYRMGEGVCQQYDFALDQWVDDCEIFDLFIGELWADEVSEEEAGEVIARRNRELRGPTLFIDADACPATREALTCARKARVSVILVGNGTQNLERHLRRTDPRERRDACGRDSTHPGFWVETLSVGTGADSADFAIIERLAPGDVVITQDIGLASMALGRGAAAIGVRGRVYDKATIDMQLFIRHEEKKVRRAGGRTAGPAAFSEDDRERFSRNLMQLLRDATRARSA